MGASDIGVGPAWISRPLDPCLEHAFYTRKRTQASHRPGARGRACFLTVPRLALGRVLQSNCQSRSFSTVRSHGYRRAKIRTRFESESSAGDPRWRPMPGRAIDTKQRPAATQETLVLLVLDQINLSSLFRVCVTFHERSIILLDFLPRQRKTTLSRWTLTESQPWPGG